MMASGLVPAFTFLMSARVFRSKIVTLLSRPLLTNPRPRSWAMAMPCTPGVSGISPTTLPLLVSRTMTCVPREMKRRFDESSTVR